MDLTPEEVALLQAIIDGNRPEPLDLRRRDGETQEAYRARLEAAREQSLAIPPGQSQALAETDMEIMPTEQWQREQLVENNPLVTRVGVAAKGIPFIGEWMDNLRGYTLGEEQAQMLRDATATFQEQNPVESTALQVGTGIVSSLPAILAAGPYVAGGAGAGLTGQVIRGGLLGTLGGGAEGVVSGAGEEGDRMQNAITRGLVGAGVGGALGVAFPPVMAGIGNLLRDPAESAAISGLGVSPQAARFLSRVLGREDQGVAQAALDQAGRTGMLADASPAARGVLDTAMQMPETPSTFGRRITDRAATVMGDVTDAMDSTLGKPQGLISIEEAIRSNAAPNIRAAYNAAYATPIDYSSPAGMAIEGIVNRLPRKTALRAIEIANDRMRWNPDAAQNQIMAQIADDGSVTFQEMPNVMQLDYMKRAFDAIARDGTDPVTGRMSSDAQFARDIARELRNATRDAVPVYGDALELASDQLSQETAVEFGSRILMPQVTREQVAREIKGATGPELQAMRLALRSQIDEQLANVRRIRSNPDADMDGRQLGAIFDMLNSDASQTKMRALLGQDADRLIAQIEAAQKSLGLAAATARNSATFGRGAVRGLLDEVSQPNAVQAFAMGQPVETTQRVVQALTNVTPESITAQGQEVINEVVDVLTRSGSAQAMQALKLIQNATAARPVTEKQAYRIAEAFTAAAAGGGYQQGTQNLTGQLRGLLAQ
jgi:hypothetical protein